MSVPLDECGLIFGDSKFHAIRRSGLLASIDEGGLSEKGCMVMRTFLLRLFNTEFGARSAISVLALILFAVGFCSTLRAYEKPLWYDELCTVILCRLQSASEIWRALDSAADGNPPLFYLVARLGRQLIPDDHLGYRLPSILGLLATLLCTYAVLCKRVDRLSALAGAAFVLCTPLAAYAFEARPYALMVGCVSAAILAWQRVDHSRLYVLALAITLFAALSLHYYAVLVWPAFVLAEASIWVGSRRFRPGTWVALLSGATPLVIFGNLLLHLRRYYGQNFWARPSLAQFLSAPSYLFNVLDYWGPSLTGGAIVILLFWSVGQLLRSPSSAWRDIGQCPPIEECALTAVLLLLPVLGIAGARVSGGGMSPRYMLPTILGGALAVGYLTSKAPHAVRVLLLALLLANYGLGSAPVVKDAVKGSLLRNRAGAARDVEKLVLGYRESGLPIVVSSGLQYLPMAYYSPPMHNGGLYALVDPPAAVTFAKSDSVDLGLLVLRNYFPLQVEEYPKFASKHREFILVSDGGGFDWWPSRLSRDGHTLSLVSADARARTYKVVLRRQIP